MRGLEFILLASYTGRSRGRRAITQRLHQAGHTRAHGARQGQFREQGRGAITPAVSLFCWQGRILYGDAVADLLQSLHCWHVGFYIPVLLVGLLAPYPYAIDRFIGWLWPAVFCYGLDWEVSNSYTICRFIKKLTVCVIG